MDTKNNMSKLEILVKQSELEPAEGQTLIEKFGDYEKIAEEWKVKAEQMIVTDASQITEMEMARVASKKFADLRIDLEKARKAMKEQSLRKGQAIDAVAKFLVSLISPIEEHLKLQANFVKIQEAKKAAEENLRLEEVARIEREAQEEAARKEQERIRRENEALKKDLEEKEKAARAERAQGEERLRVEKEKADKRQKELEAAARLESEKAEKRLIAEKEKANREKLEADRKQKELEEKLESLIECPNCHHQFKK